MSGRKNVIRSYKLLDAQSLTDSFTSNSINIQYLDNIAIQLIVTCTGNNGLFTIEVSNDDVNWNTLAVSPAIVALTSSNINIFVNIQQLAASHIRVKFVKGSTFTDGTVTAIIVAKEI